MATPTEDEAGPPSELHSTTQLVTTLQWSDFLLLIYLVAFARQYTWEFGDQATAWTMSIIMGSVLLYIHVTNRQPKTDKPGLGFWLIVGLPLAVMFSLRLPFPDVCYDQMSYHMVNSERDPLGMAIQIGRVFSWSTSDKSSA